MNNPGESQLIARCQQGEPEAWDELFACYYEPTARFVYQLSPQYAVQDVEEICQEVFLNVIRNICKFHGSSQFQTWLYRIAINQAHDYRDRQKAAKRGGGHTVLSLSVVDAESGLSLDPPSTAPGPDDQLINEEKQVLLIQALRQLGEPCQEMIELRYFADLSYEEMSSALHLNPKTVSSRLSRCLDQLEGIARRLFSKENTAPFSV